MARTHTNRKSRLTDKKTNRLPDYGIENGNQFMVGIHLMEEGVCMTGSKTP